MLENKLYAGIEKVKESMDNTKRNETTNQSQNQDRLDINAGLVKIV
jgi:hypothetical protein